jgi:hypothetical protein
VKATRQAATVATNDGKSVTGLLVEDTANRIVLHTPNNQLAVFPRNQVEGLTFKDLDFPAVDVVDDASIQLEDSATLWSSKIKELTKAQVIARESKDNAALDRLAKTERDLTEAVRKVANDAREVEERVPALLVNNTVRQQFLSHIDVYEKSNDPDHPMGQIQSQELILYRFDREPGSGTYSIGLALPKPRGRYWLQLRASQATFVFPLLAGSDRTTLYHLEIDSDGQDHSGAMRVSRASLDLSELNQGDLGKLAALSNRSSTAGYSMVLDEETQTLLRRKISDGDGTSLEAVISRLVLLRVATKGLADLIERPGPDPSQWPDVEAIRIENAFRLQPVWQAPPQGVVESLLSMLGRGLPHTVEALDYLIDRLHSTLRFAGVGEADRKRLGQLYQAVRVAASYVQNEGLFCTFATNIQQLDPLLLHVEVQQLLLR